MRSIAEFRAVGRLIGPAQSKIPYNSAIVKQRHFLLKKKKTEKNRECRATFSIVQWRSPACMCNNHNHNNNYNYFLWAASSGETPQNREPLQCTHAPHIKTPNCFAPHSNFDYTHSISRTYKNILTFLKIIIQSVLKTRQFSIETEDFQMVFAQPKAKNWNKALAKVFLGNSKLC